MDDFWKTPTVASVTNSHNDGEFKDEDIISSFQNQENLNLIWLILTPIEEPYKDVNRTIVLANNKMDDNFYIVDLYIDDIGSQKIVISTIIKTNVRIFKELLVFIKMYLNNYYSLFPNL